MDAEACWKHRLTAIRFAGTSVLLARRRLRLAVK
jgi:hypothetical protein